MKWGGNRTGLKRFYKRYKNPWCDVCCRTDIEKSMTYSNISSGTHNKVEEIKFKKKLIIILSGYKD